MMFLILSVTDHVVADIIGFSIGVIIAAVIFDAIMRKIDKR